MPANNRVELAPKLLSEVGPRVVDFISKVPATETIVSCTTTASVWSGNDPSPSAIIGGNSVSGTQVTQLFSGGVAGTIYLIDFLASTSISHTYKLSGYLAVVPDAP
jgi:hypothetical protein